MKASPILFLIILFMGCDPPYTLVLENKSGRSQNIKIRADRFLKDSIDIFCDTGQGDFGCLKKKTLLQRDLNTKTYFFVLENNEDALVSTGYDGLYGVSSLIIEGDTIHSSKDSRVFTRHHLMVIRSNGNYKIGRKLTISLYTKIRFNMKKIVTVCLLMLFISSSNLLAQGKIEPSDTRWPSPSTPCCGPCAIWQRGSATPTPPGKKAALKTPMVDYDDRISDEEIQDIVMTANLTPRKCLGFKTPFQAILKELGKDVQIRFL